MSCFWKKNHVIFRDSIPNFLSLEISSVKAVFDIFVHVLLNLKI